MGRIPENILNQIQDRCDIVEIISGYIPLKSAGRNFKALCPFHHEKTPSFTVSPDKQIYHCFGCNSGGNVFNFVKEYEKVDFIEAVKMLAERAGVKLPEYKTQEDGENSFISEMYTLNDVAANYYAKLLEKSSVSSEIRHYINKRSFNDAVIKQFRLGYADPSWKALLEYLGTRGVKLETILKAGLSLKGKDSSYYDLFRDRLIFPICDIRGRVIGFGGRVLDDGLPKYINSPESAIYRKGQHLYGLNFAKSHIREKDFAIIMEGYVDVITSHQYGICNSVASLGTALTVDQIRLLKRYTHNVIMLYDADQAGEMASLRGLDLFLEEGMNVKIAVLEKEHDPDSFLRKFGKESFDKVIEMAKSLFTYRLDILTKKINRFEPETKAIIVKEMLSTINRVKNAVIKAEYIRMLAHELSVKEEAIWDEMKKLKTMRDNRVQSTENRRERTEDRKAGETISIPPAEKILVKLMLEDVNIINAVKGELKPMDFRNPDVRNLVEALFSLDIDSRSSIDLTKLINYLEDRVAPNIVSFIANEDMEIHDKEKNVSDCIMCIKKDNKHNRLTDIQHRLNIAGKYGHKDEEKRLLEEFNKLIKGCEL